MSNNVVNRVVPSVSMLALAAILGLGGAKEAQACAAEPLVGTVCFMATNYCPVGYLPANGQVLPAQSYQALLALFGAMYGGNGSSTVGIPDLRGRNPAGVTSQTVSGNTTISPLNYGQLRGQENTALTVANLAPHNHAAEFTGTGGGGTGPMAASGTVSVPVSGTTVAQNISASGQLKIANATAAGAQVPVDGAVLTKAGGGAGAVYAPAATTASLNIGPAQTFNGTVPAAAVSGTASGPVTLPVTGATGITGGTVAIGNTGASTPFTNLPPQIGLTACVASQGIWPSRP